MINTSSLCWPNIFNVSQNKTSVYENEQSILNRVKLLLLTEPTSVYNEPNQGVGLSRYLFRYNDANVRAELLERIKTQLDLYEPCVVAHKTQWADKDLSETTYSKDSTLGATLILHTIYDTVINLDLSEELHSID